jgi:hypothetical protein
MIRKSGYRFFERIMLKKKIKPKTWNVDLLDNGDQCRERTCHQDLLGRAERARMNRMPEITAGQDRDHRGAHLRTKQ